MNRCSSRLEDNFNEMRTHLLVSYVAAAAFAAAAFAQDDAQRAKDALIVRTLLRLPGVDLGQKPDAKAALLRYLQHEKGTDKYLEIVEKFSLLETREELLRLAVEQPEGTLGVKAAGLLVKFGEE